MKITGDTNFWISATQWDNSVAHRLLLKIIDKGIEIFVTKDILDEFSEVLARDFKYTEEEINLITAKILIVATLIVTTSKIDVVKEDSEDNKILECALDSNSDYIISYDKHLLNLKEFQGIKIINPEELLGLI